MLVSGTQCRSCFLPSPGRHARRRRAGLPSASPRRGFFVPEDVFPMTPRYEPHEIEAKWQRVWEDERAFNVPNPVPGEPTPERHWYQLEMLPVSVGPEPAHGPRPQLHDGRRPDPRAAAQRLARRAPDGLGRLRAAGGERRHPRGPPSARDDRAEHRDDARPDEAPRLGDRLGPRSRGAPAGLLPLDTVAVPAVRRPRARLPQGGAGQLVPERPDRDRERVRRRRPLRALRRRGRAAEHDAVVHAGRPHMPTSCSSTTDAALARPDEGDPAQLDRPLGGRRDPLPRRGDGEDVAVFTTRADTLHGATFFVVAPEHPFVEAHASEEAKEYARHAGARPVEERAAGTEKTGVFTGLHAVNPINGEQLPIWVADYVLMDYGTGAIMAVPAHDERDGEFAETFSLAGEDGDRRGREARQLRPLRRAAGGRGRTRDRRRARAGGTRPGDGQLPPARLERVAAALLGLPDPVHPLRALRRRAGARGRAAGDPARHRGLRPEGQAAARSERGVHGGRLPAVRRPGAARPGHDGHVRRLVLVLPALHRLAQRRGAVRPLRRRLLAAGLPVHRRDRPLDGASALLALLRQGDERLGDGRLPRAVRARLPPGLGDARRHEDVEDEGERRRAGRVRRRVRRRRGAALHPLHGPRRPGHGVDGLRHRGHRPLPAAAVARRARDRRAGAVAAGVRVRAIWRGRRTRRSRE